MQDARIASLSIRTEENTETYLWRGMEHLFGFEFTASDDAGRLNLPPLPDGAVVDLRIDHPRWAQAKLLLDFWFTGCGPCHYDFPSVKLIHERFEKLGVTVIAVHDNSSSPEAVLEHCRQQGLAFPIVVGHQNGRILGAYRQLGVTSFPTYILLGPDGNILGNGSVTNGPPLRTFKLEVVRGYVLHPGDEP